MPVMSRIYRYLIKFFVDDYVEWHNKTIHKINAGILDSKNVRVLVNWSENGIGDRFKGLCKAYFLSVITKRLFLLKWESHIPLSKVFRYDLNSNFTLDADKFVKERVFVEQIFRNVQSRIDAITR